MSRWQQDTVENLSHDLDGVLEANPDESQHRHVSELLRGDCQKISSVYLTMHRVSEQSRTLYLPIEMPACTN